MPLLALLFALVFSTLSYAQESLTKEELLNILPDDIVLGKQDAPVTIIEYSSLSCKYCAAFHSNVLPKLKNRFIDTGKVRFVNRHYPFNEPALKAAMISHCAPKERYYDFLSAFYELQNKWAFTPDFANKIRSIAIVGGMHQDEIEQCFKNTTVETAILMSRKHADEHLKIKGTPTFFINGNKLEVNATIENLARAIEGAITEQQ